MYRSSGQKHRVTAIFRSLKQRSRPALVITAFAIIGCISLVMSQASTSTASLEPEQGAIAGCATAFDDTSASAGKTLRFGPGAGCADSAGAQLPIQYNIDSITQVKKFVDDQGSDTTGDGSIGSPYKSIAKAYAMSSAGNAIIVRGGTYTESGVTITQGKSIRISAYPGETPVFTGAQTLTNGWNNEGDSLAYHAYTPQPVTNGSGLSFTTGQALTGDGVGKFPDQVWIDNTQLQQVSQKSAISSSTFWVDAANNRLYLSATNAAQSNIQASDKDTLFTVFAPNTIIEGLRITRYSNSADDYGVVKFMASADNSLLNQVEISENSFIALAYLGDSHINTNSTVRNVSILNSNWMGVSVLYTEGFSMESVKINGMNSFNEFTQIIQSGGLKTSRTRNTKVINSDVSDNNGQGLWFDQSNLHVEVAGNRLVNNSNSGVFFEISDGLYMVNNYIQATGDARAVKLAASSGLYLVNNTMIGGSDVLGVYVDERSKPGCSDPTQPLCGNSYESDRDSFRPFPDTMTWIPAIDLMINNIIAYPTGQGWCGGVTALCITNTNAGTNVALQQVIHQANSTLGVPQTFMDSNVYANGGSNIAITIQNRYTTLSSFSQALAGSPVSIPGLEQNGKYGNSWVQSDGTPSPTLAQSHSQATAVPTQATINKYLPAGYKHFGVTSK